MTRRDSRILTFSVPPLADRDYVEAHEMKVIECLLGMTLLYESWTMIHGTLRMNNTV